MTEDDKDREIRELRAALAERDAKEGSRSAPEPVGAAKSDGVLGGWGGFGLFGGIALVVVLLLAWSGGREHEAAEQAVAAPVAHTPIVPVWEYSSSADPMTDRVTHYACIRSRNQARLEPPYDDVFAQLCVRDKPRVGLDVYVALDGDGQILCRSYDGCRLGVRYDDGAVQAFSAVGSSDLSSNIVFFENARRMLAGVESADLTRVEIEFYRAGTQQLEFETANLQWPPPEAAPTP